MYLVIRNLIAFWEEESLIDTNTLNILRSKIKRECKDKIDSYVPSKENIKESFEKIKVFYPNLEIFYKLMHESGCRFTELKYMILNFNEKNIEQSKEERITIYRNFYLRGQKASYYLFFTSDSFEKLKLIVSDTNEDQLNSFKDRITRDKNIVSLKYLRKYHFTLLVEHDVSFEIANFIQGRASQNVGFNSYLSKKIIAIKEYKKILGDINENN